MAAVGYHAVALGAPQILTVTPAAIGNDTAAGILEHRQSELPVFLHERRSPNAKVNVHNRYGINAAL
jgi:hypothetical protein